MLLAGDIGGTKTQLALYGTNTGPDHPLVSVTVKSAHYRSPDALLRAFLASPATEGLHPTHACLGVAGPVWKGRSQFTNLRWTMDERTLAREFGLARVKLLNDLEASIHAFGVLGSNDLAPLAAGVGDPQGPRAVIAPGTGLGEAYAVWDGVQYRAFAAEGGHAEFAPRNRTQLALLHFLMERYEHVSYERICSGTGIPNIYAFFKSHGYEEPEWLANKLAAVKDPTPVIVNTALGDPMRSPLCTATLRLFVEVLGQEAGNLALKTLATGGVYLAGGIPPRILDVLRDGAFMSAFWSKGRMSRVVRDIPVQVILHPKLAMLGAAAYGLVRSHRSGEGRPGGVVVDTGDEKVRPGASVSYD